LNRRIVACRNCRRAPGFLPVVGSGHPLADIMLVKHQPHYLEVNEGVSFYGRSGSAIIKSMERLSVNPLVVYGTNIVKCHDVRPIDGEKNCPLFWLEDSQQDPGGRHEEARLGPWSPAVVHPVLQGSRDP
jgi:uracil-DNA glycosylase